MYKKPRWIRYRRAYSMVMRAGMKFTVAHVEGEGIIKSGYQITIQGYIGLPWQNIGHRK